MDLSQYSASIIYNDPKLSFPLISVISQVHLLCKLLFNIVLEVIKKVMSWSSNRDKRVVEDEKNTLFQVLFIYN